MGWSDSTFPGFDEIEARRLAENRENARSWLEPTEPIQPQSMIDEPTSEPNPMVYLGNLLASLSRRAQLSPVPQRSSLYDENAPLNMEPIKESTLRNYTGEDYARGDFVGASSRGNREPYYANALPEMLPVVGGKSLLGGWGRYSPRGEGVIDDLKGYNNPLPSPGLRPQMPIEDKSLSPGINDQTGDILTTVLALMGLPGVIRGAVGATAGLSEKRIMDILGSRGITSTGLKEAIPGLASKMEGRSWIGDLLRGGTGITPESLRGFVGGFTRAKNAAKGAAQGAGNLFRGTVEPTPATLMQKIVGEKATKSVLPTQLDEDSATARGTETLWGQLQRLKGMGNEGLQSVQTPIREIANTWGPNPETQKWLYDYVVKQRAPWNQ